MILIFIFSVAPAYISALYAILNVYSIVCVISFVMNDMFSLDSIQGHRFQLQLFFVYGTVILIVKQSAVQCQANNPAK